MTIERSDPELDPLYDWGAADDRDPTPESDAEYEALDAWLEEQHARAVERAQARIDAIDIELGTLQANSLMDFVFSGSLLGSAFLRQRDDRDAAMLKLQRERAFLFYGTVRPDLADGLADDDPVRHLLAVEGLPF